MDYYAKVAKGSRRLTNYATQAILENVARTAIQLGIESIEVKIKGLGYGKESSLRGLRLGDLIITRIQNVSPTPHNGCRHQKWMEC
jgi:small subunit ribosomal protein S11